MWPDSLHRTASHIFGGTANRRLSEEDGLVVDLCTDCHNRPPNGVHFNKERMEESAKKGFTNATDAADYLVRAGVPFRDAHGIVGRLVLTCIERGIALDDLPLEEYQKESSAFGPDIYDAISMKTCVSTRNTKGAPGPQALEEMLAQQKSEMEKLDKEEGFA